MNSNLIAIILPDLRGGGVEKMRIHLAKYFLLNGYEVHFVLLQKKGELLTLIPEVIEIFDLQVEKMRYGIFPLFRYFRKNKPCAVLVAMWPLTIITSFAKILSGIKSSFILSEHNHHSSTPLYKVGFNRFLIPFSMKLVYPFSDMVVGVSEGVVLDLLKLSGLKKEKLKTIYNPAAPTYEYIESIQPNNQYWKSSSSKKIVAIGSLKKQKDFFTLLRAFKHISSSIEIELLILGEGPEREKIEFFIEKNKLNECVYLPGFVDHPIAFLKTADLFVLSSAWEGFGNVIVEALSCGIPVVSTNCKSGPSEILKNGKFGSLVPVGDADKLAVAVLEALKKDHDIESLIKRAHDFRVDKIALEYLRLLFPDRKLN